MHSKLTNAVYVDLPGHATRSDGVDHIILHHMAADLSLDTCYQVLKGAGSSANYMIDSAGMIGCALSEHLEPYTTANRYIDDRAITIEVANSGGAPDWPISDKALQATIDLCADICARHSIKKLVFTGDTTGNLEMHRWYYSTTCPGNYLASKFPYIAAEVNKILGNEPTIEPNEPTTNNESVVSSYVESGTVLFTHETQVFGSLQDAIDQTNPQATYYPGEVLNSYDRVHITKYESGKKAYAYIEYTSYAGTKTYFAYRDFQRNTTVGHIQ